MKIFLTVMIMIATTSTFATCVFNGACTDAAECTGINSTYSLVGGKCIDPAASQNKETDCKGIVGSQAPKNTTLSTDPKAPAAPVKEK
ncbi:MAG: hypothetical protein Q7U04_11575 [Bacteriovorax sp.]|nr:hypothetical protein [Bacteriovorax sp.]